MRWIVMVAALAAVMGCGGAPAMAPPASSADSRAGGYAVESEEAVVSDDGAQVSQGPSMPAPPGEKMLADRGGEGEATVDESTGTPPAEPTEATKGPPEPEAPGSNKPEGVKPLLIYRADYQLAVFETDEGIEKVHQMAEELGGYLVRRDDQAITVRVPSEKYRGAIDRIVKIGDVLSRKETVEDVTEKFLDLKTRLKNHRAMRARLENLLEQAETVKEALAVEKELARVTGKIERIEGKLKRLSELIAFSTITVRFQSMPTERVDSNVRLPFPWLDRLGLPNLLNL